MAGCWTARHLAEQGMSVLVLEALSQPASAASGNPAGMFKPFVTRSPCFAMDFYLAANAFLNQQLEKLSLKALCNYTLCGVTQLVQNTYPESKHYHSLNNAGTSNRLGTSVDANSIFFDKAGWLDPSSLCKALLQHPLICIETNTAVDGIVKTEQALLSDARWRVVSNDRVFHGTHIVIANGVSLNQTQWAENLPIVPARGQISRFNVRANAEKITSVANGKHYVIPDGNSVLVGATFLRNCSDSSIRKEDHAANFKGLQKLLPSLDTEDQPIAGYAGVRATTPDRLPLAGPLPDYAECHQAYADLHHGKSLSNYPPLPIHEGLYVLGGLGSRGITTAPMAAALLVDHLLGSRTPVSSIETLTYWSPLLNPARFYIRALKRKTP